MNKILTLCFVLLALCMFTGCETVKSAFYEPVPYDEVAAEQGITMEEAEALGLVQPKPELEPLVNTISTLIPVPGVASVASLP